MRKITAIIILATIFTSCEEQFNSLAEIDQPVLFKVEYMNFAWGYDHEGYIIDKTGSVRSFDRDDEWNFPDDNGYISISELTENVDQLPEVSQTVDSDLLLKYFNKMHRVDPEALTDRENVSVDAGSTRYSGFILESKQDTCREVVLKVVGDWSYENTSREAKQIYKWLSEIYEDLK